MNHSTRARTQARYRAVQSLYQWQLAGQDLKDIESQFLSGQDMSKVDVPYFQSLLHGVPKNLNELDAALKDVLDRPVEQLDPVEHAILRLAIYEFQHCLEVPYRVVINEAVELAKTFGAQDGHKYINGVLDKVAKSLRPVEIAEALRVPH